MLQSRWSTEMGKRPCVRRHNLPGSAAIIGWINSIKRTAGADRNTSERDGCSCIRQSTAWILGTVSTSG